MKTYVQSNNIDVVGSLDVFRGDKEIMTFGMSKKQSATIQRKACKEIVANVRKMAVLRKTNRNFF
jgi:hypothetical protein